MKISSGLSNNYPLIREIIKKKIPLIISTGLSDFKELIELRNFLKNLNLKKYQFLNVPLDTLSHLTKLKWKILLNIKKFLNTL